MIRIGLLPVAIALLIPVGVRAELGGAVSSLPAANGLPAPRATAVAMGGYTRYETARDNGGVVREFVNPGGRVFAVTWSGPGKPDLRMLLGRYFETMQTPPPGTRREPRALRRPMQVSQPDVQITAGGHMGWFHGVAFLPALAPANFAVAELSPLS